MQLEKYLFQKDASSRTITNEDELINFLKNRF